MKNKHLFYIFLFINAILWTLIQCLRTVISIDSMEAISWGELISFGTNKHPPLSGWLMAGAYNLLGEHNIAAYILGQVCIVIGLIFVYKLARRFMDENKAMCSSMVITACYYYTYIVLIDNFNCNFLSMCLWPMIVYYFHKSVKENRIKDWMLFGVLSGLGFLAKYQVVFLFAALFIYLIVCERKQFRQKGMYVSVFTGFLVILPHIIWLFQNDFFSFIYMTGRTSIGAHNTPNFLVRFGRVVFPIKFLLDQICSVIVCIVLYVFLALQAKNIEFKNRAGSFSDKVFLLSVCFIPILAQGSMALFTESRIQGIWGSIMVSFMGIVLFYFFPVKFNKDSFKFFVKMMYVSMFLWLAGMFIFMELQTKRVLSYPKEEIMKNFDIIWKKKKKNAPLKYVGGHIDYVFQFRLYNKHHPTVILETFGHKNPWINHEDVLKSGAIILGKTAENASDYTTEIVTLLPKDYKIVPRPYKFEIKNKLGKTKEYEFFYVIVPPAKE